VVSMRTMPARIDGIWEAYELWRPDPSRKSSKRRHVRFFTRSGDAEEYVRPFGLRGRIRFHQAVFFADGRIYLLRSGDPIELGGPSPDFQESGSPTDGRCGDSK